MICLTVCWRYIWISRIYKNILSNILDICKVCFTFGKSRFTIMKSRFLFPYWCKYLGVALFLIHLPVMLLKRHFGLDFPNAGESAGFFNSQYLFFVVTTLTMLSGLVMIAFSKEKVEDEQITQLRMDTLQISIYLNYILLITALIFTGRDGFWDIIRLNMWVPLMFFIVLFRWKMYRNSRFSQNDTI